MTTIKCSRQLNWRSRYNEGVRKSTEYYEYLNNKATTIIRKITPEEKQYYEELLNPRDCHRLVL